MFKKPTRARYPREAKPSSPPGGPESLRRAVCHIIKKINLPSLRPLHPLLSLGAALGNRVESVPDPGDAAFAGQGTHTASPGHAPQGAAPLASLRKGSKEAASTQSALYIYSFLLRHLPATPGQPARLPSAAAGQGEGRLAVGPAGGEKPPVSSQASALPSGLSGPCSGSSMSASGSGCRIQAANGLADSGWRWPPISLTLKGCRSMEGGEGRGHWGKEESAAPRMGSSLPPGSSAESVRVEGELSPLLLEADQALVICLQVLGLLHH